MTKGGFTIVYNGEIYNAAELRRELADMDFSTKSDTEVILNAYIRYGSAAAERLNGIFAFAVWDGLRLALCRDHAGIKPLFYSVLGDRLVFGSEIKALFAYPGIAPAIDKDGLCEIFAISPARSPGCGVFKGVSEIPPGHFGVYGPDGFRLTKYWDVSARPHTHNYSETVEAARFLVTDAIKRQLVSDVPVCCFLSGGVDSSLTTAVAARELPEINTFAFDFEGNGEFFKESAYIPSRDNDFAREMAEYAGSRHTELTCRTADMALGLFESVRAKDLPGMADVDSSLLWFCGEVAKSNKVALSGECADEIFGGYPWFHSRLAFETPAFPWSAALDFRESLLSGDLLGAIDLDGYARSAYEAAAAETPRLPGEPPEEARRREIAYLNLKWFMTTLTDRLDRASMRGSLEARVPFADFRIIEYVFNVPWEIKCRGGEVKHLLRAAARGFLPDSVLSRKKSPYPKSHNPLYLSLLREYAEEAIAAPNNPLFDLVDKEKFARFVRGDALAAADKPWFGQLMGAPQMAAYLLQVGFWLKEYNVKIDL
jgi:asparagine synthase (glutamine-hydrolysing)